MKGDIPNGWRDGVVKPVYKKGQKDEAGNYVEITLMDTDYKIRRDSTAKTGERARKERDTSGYTNGL